jgi:sulfite exporter TauE/SafE
MHWRDFRILVYFVVAAVIFGIVGWVTLAPTITWIIPIVTLGLILLGLGINSLVLVTHTYKKIEAISETLKSIEQIQEAIQKEQKEQSSSNPPIVPTLQAFSQLYLDYVTKQQIKDEQQKSTDDV